MEGQGEKEGGERGWKDEDRHDVVPQPGKKKQKQEARTRQTSLNYRAQT